MFLDPKYIVGRKFTTAQLTTTEYTCIGYDNNGTSILFGVAVDAAADRSQIKSFKVTEVTFKGNVVLDPSVVKS